MASTDSKGRVIHQASDSERRAVVKAAADQDVVTHLRDDRESHRTIQRQRAKIATELQQKSSVPSK